MHVNFYTPVAENLSLLWVVGVKFSWIVLLVQYAIFMFVCLNILVMYLVYLSMYISVKHY